MSDPRVAHITDETLHAYLDKELTGKARSELEKHLGECRDCSVRLESWSQLFLEIGRLPDLELGSDLAPIILDHLAAKGHRSQWTSLLLAGQAGLTVTLLAFGWRSLISTLTFHQIGNWLSLPVQALGMMTDTFTTAFVDTYIQYQNWFVTKLDLVIRLPQVGEDGTRLIFAALLLVLLWFSGNHYLLRANGRAENVRP